MIDDRMWRRIKPILEDAIELPVEQRTSFVQDRCGDDTELLAAVQRLLAAHERAGNLLEPTATASPSESIQEERFSVPDIPGLEPIKELGRGAQGVVLEALDTKLRRRVALKVLFSGRESEARERFRREAQIAGTLNHPNVVQVFEFGEAKGTLFYTMPLVQGLPLHNVIPFLHNASEVEAPEWLSLPSKRADRLRVLLQWFEGALDGLHLAHEKGIVHRDLKPANLLLDRVTGHLCVADFGLARAWHLDEVTKTGVVMGTVTYMSPEQVRGGKVDRRSDVYSMGVTMYSAIFDRAPYDARSPAEYLNKIVHTTPIDRFPSEKAVPRDLLTILLKAIEKSPTNRYATAADFREDLSRFLRYEPIEAHPVGWLGKTTRWARRRPAIALMVALLAVATTLAGGLSAKVFNASRVAQFAEADRVAVDATYRMSTGEFKDAFALFDKVNRLNPNHLDGRLGRSWAAMEYSTSQPSEASAEKLGVALRDLAAVDRIQPGLMSAHAIRARILRALDREEEADGADRMALESEPIHAIDYQVLADLARKEGDCRKAIDLYGAALELDPSRPWSLLHRGLCFKRTGQHRLARVEYEILSRVSADHHMAHNNLGTVLMELGETRKALAALRKALEIKATPEVQSNMGWALYKARKYEDAERYLRLALERKPDLSQARNILGRVLERTNRKDEAIQEFQEVVRREGVRPTGPTTNRIGNAHTNLCNLLLERSDIERASTSCEKALEHRPNSANAHYNMAWLSILKGDVSRALDHLCVNADLGDTDYQYLLDDVHFRPLHSDLLFKDIVQRMKRRACAT